MDGGKRLAQKKKRLEWSKILPVLVILAGFIIAQECIVLMYLCIRGGYDASAAWLTAAIGLAEAVIGLGAKCYFDLAKSDHREGGITYEAAKAANFNQPQEPEGSVDSPAI